MDATVGRQTVIKKFTQAAPVFRSAERLPKTTLLRYKKALRLPEGRAEKSSRGSYLNRPLTSYLQSECSDFVGACEWPIEVKTTPFRIGPFFSDDSPLSHHGVDLHVAKGTEIRTCKSGEIINVFFDRDRNMLDLWVYSSKSQILWRYAHLEIECTLRLFPMYESLLKDPCRTSFHEKVQVKGHRYIPVEAKTLIGTVGNWLWDHPSYADSGVEVVFGTKFTHLHLETQFNLQELIYPLMTFLIQLPPDNMLNPLFLLKPLFPLDTKDIP